MSNILKNVLNIARVNHSRCCNITEILWNRLFCLFGVFRPTREFFPLYGDITIAGEGLSQPGIEP